MISGFDRSPQNNLLYRIPKESVIVSLTGSLSFMEYDGSKWRAKRESILRRDGYQDKIKKRYGKLIQATIVHHIFPADEFPEYAWQDWNLISVSLETHNELHDRNTNELTAKGVELLRRTARRERIPVPDKYMHEIKRRPSHGRSMAYWTAE